MKRRGALVVAVGSAAGAAGLGLAQWRQRASTASNGVSAETPTADASVWSLRFDRPTGGELSMAAFRGRPLLLNFWATWCPPCVRELPLLDQFQRAQPAGGWQVAGLAVDRLESVLGFLGQHSVQFAVGLAGVGGIELARRLGNSGGALPFTVVFDRAGTPVHRKLGVIESADLRQWVASVA